MNLEFKLEGDIKIRYSGEESFIISNYLDMILVLIFLEN